MSQLAFMYLRVFRCIVKISFVRISIFLSPSCKHTQSAYSYKQIKRADQQLAWRRGRSKVRGKLVYISRPDLEFRSFLVTRSYSTQTRHSVTQCTWSLGHAVHAVHAVHAGLIASSRGACGADSKITTSVNCLQQYSATSERIVSVRWAPS